jgi:hypothetical protein
MCICNRKSTMTSAKKPAAVRLSAVVKALAVQRAREECRSFASYLEWLVLQDIKRQQSTTSGQKESDAGS